MQRYCLDPWKRTRVTTKEVQIGTLRLGGENPIRVQSMTTTDTMDTEGSVAQSIRMIDAGCELVRLTAPSKNEAENLQKIKDALVEKGYNTPLVADIHFTPNAAEIAAKKYASIRATTPTKRNSKKSITPMTATKQS
jgi:(E)-4-hydroxy-3-methylbut-2-enyl-diphosphate synthase